MAPPAARSREFPFTLDLRVRSPGDAERRPREPLRAECWRRPTLHRRPYAGRLLDELHRSAGRRRRAPGSWQRIRPRSSSARRRRDRRAAARAGVAGAQIHENGVTYNVYGDADGPARPWALDVLPPHRARGRMGAARRGLAQRARLLERDPRRPLRSAAAARRAAAAAGARLRPSGVPAPGARHHAAAAAASCTWSRSTSRAAPDGRWRVLGDAHARRRRAPATRSRIASRSRGSSPRRSATARAACSRRSSGRCARRCSRSRPSDGETPHIVLLTPGPYNETYFEHAYLARYLGFTLVEGGDLTVRDDRVYLKTVGGPRARGRHPAPARRRLLRSAGAARRLDLGVPGLVQAWRAGNVLRRQRARRRHARIAGAAWRSCRPSASGCSARRCAAVGRDLVVRRACRARGASRPSRADGHQAGVSRRRRSSR